MITSMKFFITVVLISLFATVQAQFSFGAPAPGSTISAGQNVTLQIIVPIDTSEEAGELEVSLVIGIVDCPSSSCPAPSANLGDILFIGKYQSQGEIGNTLQSFENFTFTLPAGISGPASFQAQRNFLLTLPNQAIPTIECQSLAVEVSS